MNERVILDLQLDTSRFDRSINQTTRDVANMNAQQREAFLATRGTIERLQISTRLLGQALAQATDPARIQSLSRELQNARGQLNAMQQAARPQRTFIDQMRSSLGLGAGIGAGMGLVAGVVALGTAVKDLATASINAAATAEGTFISFRTMLGSSKAAFELVEEIKKKAATTPFEVTELNDYVKRLLAMGISHKDVIKDLDTLGNIGAAVGKEKMPQIVLAFGQVKAATKLMGGELKQFTEAGVPLLDLLAKQSGKTAGQIRKDMEKGVGPSFDEVRRALESTTAAGGKFFNLMQDQSKTLDGLRSNLADVSAQTLEAFGARMLEPMKAVTQGAIDLLETFKELVEVPLSEKMQEEIGVMIGLNAQLQISRDNRAEEIGIINEMQKIYPDLLLGLNKEMVTREDINKGIERYIKLQQQAIAAQTAKEYADKKQAEFMDANLEKQKAIAELQKIYMEETGKMIPMEALVGGDMVKVASNIVKEFKAAGIALSAEFSLPWQTEAIDYIKELQRNTKSMQTELQLANQTAQAQADNFEKSKLSDIEAAYTKSIFRQAELRKELAKLEAQGPQAAQAAGFKRAELEEQIRLTNEVEKRKQELTVQSTIATEREKIRIKKDFIYKSELDFTNASPENKAIIRNQLNKEYELLNGLEANLARLEASKEPKSVVGVATPEKATRAVEKKGEAIRKAEDKEAAKLIKQFEDAEKKRAEISMKAGELLDKTRKEVTEQEFYYEVDATTKLQQEFDRRNYKRTQAELEQFEQKRKELQRLEKDELASTAVALRQTVTEKYAGYYFELERLQTEAQAKSASREIEFQKALEQRKLEIKVEYWQKIYNTEDTQLALNAQNEIAHDLELLNKKQITQEQFEERKTKIEEEYRKIRLANEIAALKKRREVLGASAELDLEIKQKENELATPSAAKTGLSSKDKVEKAVNVYKEISDGAVGYIQSIMDKENELLDMQISNQEKRLDTALKLAELGNTQYLEQEQRRLDELNRQRERAVERQIALDNAAKASALAVEAIRAFMGGNGGGGGANGSFGRLGDFLGNLQFFAEGTPSVPLKGNRPGIDTVPAMLTAGERVMSVQDNLKFGPLVDFAKKHPEMFKNGIPTFGRVSTTSTSGGVTTFNDGNIVYQLKENNTLQRKMLNAMSKKQRGGTNESDNRKQTRLYR